MQEKFRGEKRGGYGTVHLGDVKLPDKGVLERCAGEWGVEIGSDVA